MKHRIPIFKPCAVCLLLTGLTGIAQGQMESPPASDPVEMYARIERERAMEVWFRQQQALRTLPYVVSPWPPHPMMPYWPVYPAFVPVPVWGCDAPCRHDTGPRPSPRHPDCPDGRCR